MQKCISHALSLCTVRQVLTFRESGHAVVHKLCTLLMHFAVSFGFQGLWLCKSA